MIQPDSRWLPFLKMTFGFLLLVMLTGLAVIIALGKVEQQTSHGLEGIIGGLTALAGGFVNWAFTVSKKDEP
jgi:hypothetical protein